MIRKSTKDMEELRWAKGNYDDHKPMIVNPEIGCGCTVNRDTRDDWV
jgi:hypothetical protein